MSVKAEKVLWCCYGLQKTQLVESALLFMLSDGRCCENIWSAGRAPVNAVVQKNPAQFTRTHKLYLKKLNLLIITANMIKANSNDQSRHRATCSHTCSLLPKTWSQLVTLIVPTQKLMEGSISSSGAGLWNLSPQGDVERWQGSKEVHIGCESGDEGYQINTELKF